MKKLVYFLTILTLLGCSQEAHKINFTGQTQGTYYAITYFSPDGDTLQQEIDSLLALFDLTASMWVDESLISRVNRNDTTVSANNIFIDLFTMSKEVSELTGGSFDMTVGPLINAWGFGSGDKLDMDQHIIDSLLPLVNYKNVSLAGNKVIKKEPGIQLDFNAIAQGYAVDLLGEYLESRGIFSYLVDIGGEVLARGEKPGNQQWIVGIERPSPDKYEDRTLITKIRLKNKAMATSGNYRKYYVKEGMKYSHTIDPATGYPVSHSLLSVTVMSDDCATADAYATAFMVMGLERSLDFIKDNEETGLEAYFIYGLENGEMGTKYTRGFEGLIVR